MSAPSGYGRYRPIAVAAEVMAERWTPLVLRALHLGAVRFNEIHASVPRMSPALLTRRLRELERANVLERRPAPSGRGAEYRLTQAGRELFPVLEAMGLWAMRWLEREVFDDRNLDPGLLMWELRRIALNAERPARRRRTVRFEMPDAPADRRLYWLVFEPEDVDICLRDPGFEVDLWITATIRTLVEVWLGRRGLSEALDAGAIALDGPPSEIRAFRDWFVLSPYAGAA